MDPLELLNEEEFDDITDEDIQHPDFQLNSETKTTLRNSWITLQER